MVFIKIFQQHKYHNRQVFDYYYLIKVISNVYMWWICYCCLCLINNSNIQIVNGAYSDTEDLINELDRPSKFI